MRAWLVAAVLVLATTSVAHADKLELADGTAVEGEVLRHDSKYIWLRVEGRVQRFELADVVALHRDDPPSEDATDREEPRRESDDESGSDDAEPAPAPTGDGSAKPAPATTNGERPPTRAEREAQARRDAVTKRVLHLFSLGKTQARIAAQQELVRGWPWSSDALDAALAHDDARIRADAVRVLSDENLGDQTQRLLRALDDRSATVRMLAVREIGDVDGYARNGTHDRRTEIEERLARLLDEEPEWPVRQEVLRTLERVGTKLCLRAVVDGFATAHDEYRRSRHHRALVAIVGHDLGDDPDAWR